MHSDKLHIVERYRRPDHNTLTIDMTLDDSKAFTKPWSQNIVRQLRPDWKLNEYVFCDEKYRKGVFYGEGPGGL